MAIPKWLQWLWEPRCLRSSSAYVSLYKVANDIRLMSRGPRAGFAELKIPERGDPPWPGNSGLREAEQRSKALSIWRTREARLLKQASAPWGDRIPQPAVLPKALGPFYNHSMKISARNQLRGTVETVDLGVVTAKVGVRVGENLIESVITKQSVEDLNIKVGSEVTAIIKSTEVMLMVD
jgi:molybdopterin-binding protein